MADNRQFFVTMAGQAGMRDGEHECVKDIGDWLVLEEQYRQLVTERNLGEMKSVFGVPVKEAAAVLRDYRKSKGY